MVKDAYRLGRRLVAPLMGFPGLAITGGNIKLAQQNYGQHYRVVKALADRFHPDMIFPLMDLAVEANALGQFTLFPKDEAATVMKEEFTSDRLEELKRINVSFDTRLLGYVETLKLVSIGISDSLLGAYVIGPYTLSALIIGAEEAALASVMRPDDLHLLCRFATEIIQEYSRLLIGAGAQVLCVLEPSAVMLGPESFKSFSADYVRHINNSCRYTDVATVYHTCGNTNHLLEQMVASGVDAISLDSPKMGVFLPDVAKRIPEEVIIIGNICPTDTILYGSPTEVKEEVIGLLDAMSDFPNFVLSTGCDLPQETPLENIEAFMDAGKSYSIAI